MQTLQIRSQAGDDGVLHLKIPVGTPHAEYQVVVLQPRDVETARAAEAAVRQEWCASRPEELVELGGEAARTRFSRLFQFLRSGRLEVRFLPDEVFGLIHGKRPASSPWPTGARPA